MDLELLLLYIIMYCAVAVNAAMVGTCLNDRRFLWGSFHGGLLYICYNIGKDLKPLW